MVIPQGIFDQLRCRAGIRRAAGYDIQVALAAMLPSIDGEGQIIRQQVTGNRF